MKKKLSLICTTIAAILLCSLNKANAQSWVVGGNTVSADASLGTKNSHSLKLITNNTQRMIFDDLGQVGIGTSSLYRARFTVNGSIGNTNAIFANNNHGISMTFDNPAIGFNTYYNTAWKTLNTGYGGWISVNNTTGQMQFATLPYGIKDSSVTSAIRMTILQNGYVGIGTVAPATKLQVNGDETLTGNLFMNSDQKSIQFATPSASPAPMMYMFPSGTVNNDRMVIAHSPSYPDWGLRYSDLSDEFDFLGAGTSVLHIDLSSHYIGIGTTTPAYTLDVCGTVRAKEVRVETGWCDYVFDKNYKLKPLDEVEQYINQNKHLPGIAPASEVEKDGLKVGEMNKTMMEKIEELTLYVIDLSKENKKLQQEIDALKK